MTLSSYSDVFSIQHDCGHAEAVYPGDIVRTGRNLFPHFEVLAVRGDTAWVRNVQDGCEHLAQRSRFRRLAGQVLAQAAE